MICKSFVSTMAKSPSNSIAIQVTAKNIEKKNSKDKHTLKKSPEGGLDIKGSSLNKLM